MARGLKTRLYDLGLIRGALGDKSRRQSRPSRLVTGPAATPGLGVEILMELHQIPPMRIVGIPPLGPETRTMA